MKNNFEKLIRKAGARVALTEAERDKMRFVLREYAGMKPVRAAAVAARTHALSAFIHALLAYLRRPASITVAALLMLALSSGGIAYAAEGTLPGDVLYPVKVAVIEPLRVALASSPEASASLQMAFAERRVDEAATLAREGRLGTSTEAALAANFNKNADGAAVTVARERAQDPTAADVLETNFAARLAAYENVLAAVNERSRDTSDTTRFQAVIRAQAVSITSAQASDEASSSSPRDASAPENQESTSENARHLRDAADAALRVSADIIGTASSTLDSSSSASARDELSRASALANQGRALLEQHDENGASRAFQDSLSATARLDVLTRASAKLRIQAFATTTASTTSEIKTDESSDAEHADSAASEKAPPAQEDQGNQGLPFGL